MIPRPPSYKKQKRWLVIFRGTTVRIPLTHGKEAIIDRDDWDAVRNYTWYAADSNKQGHFYARAAAVLPSGNKTTVLMGRVILNAPAGLDVDHANGNTLDYRRKNIRLATERQNVFNRRRVSGTRFKGVSLVKSKRVPRPWHTRIVTDVGIRISIGYFASAIAAAKAYDAAARLYFGQFAAVNFPRKGERSCRK